MKKIILFLLLLTSAPAFAQKIHFTDSSNIWVYDLPNNGDMCPGQTIYSYGHDTFLHGHTYRQLIQNGMDDGSSFTSSCLHWVYNGYLTLYVREDTTAGIVYSLVPLETTERILFNFNLRLGDTISNFSDSTTVIHYSDSVFKIDSVLVGSFFYKIFHLKTMRNPSGIGGFDQTIVEGMGTPNFLKIPAYGYWDEHGEFLRCFSNRGTYPAFNGIWNWAPYKSSDTFNNSPGCANLNITPVKPLKDEIKITPNPSSSGISFSSSHVIHEIIITNISGTAVLRVTPFDKRANISIEHLPPGLYFTDIRFGEDGKQRYLDKIVKE